MEINWTDRSINDVSESRTGISYTQKIKGTLAAVVTYRVESTL